MAVIVRKINVVEKFSWQHKENHFVKFTSQQNFLYSATALYRGSAKSSFALICERVSNTTISIVNKYSLILCCVVLMKAFRIGISLFWLLLIASIDACTDMF